MYKWLSYSNVLRCYNCVPLLQDPLYSGAIAEIDHILNLQKKHTSPLPERTLVCVYCEYFVK